MSDHTGDDAMDDGTWAVTGLDGSGLVRAFERARSRALSDAGAETARERTEWVLEATSYASALEAIGRLSSIGRTEKEALAARARRTLLTLAGLRPAGVGLEEDERDALDVAARYAREGLRALTGTAAEPFGGGDAPPPPVRDLVRLVRGDLDGFASADVALRLRGSRRGLAELARLVPSITSPAAIRFQVAAESSSVTASTSLALRDPSEGRAVGSLSLDGGGELEAIAFDRDLPASDLRASWVLAIYAEPALSLRVSGVGAHSSAAIESTTGRPGYVEVRVTDVSAPLTLRVEYDDRVLEWVLSLA